MQKHVSIFTAVNLFFLPKFFTMKRTNFYKAFLLIGVILTGITSCNKEADETLQGNLPAINTESSRGFATNDMVMYWNEKAAMALNTPLTPPAQCRYFAMIQIAVHDALNAIKPKFERYALTNEREQHASADAAVASAAYWAIKLLNQQGTLPIDSWLSESLASIQDGDAKSLGIALGKRSAEAILQKRSGDQFAGANVQIPLPDGTVPGAYRSTLPFSNEGMPKIKALHQWGLLMLPFVTQSNTQFRSVNPYPVNSPEYTLDYNEVKSKGGRFNHTRTANEQAIGVFWVERSSMGWNRFARTLVQSKKMDAWKTARLFAVMHTAMVDAVSTCFESKYHYFYWRPETAIRLGETDGNPSTAGDAAWLPSYTEGPNPLNPLMSVNTPPIPDHPSAHANMGGAAGQVLKMFFGSDNISADLVSNTLPGVTRHYSSIQQACRDNSLSRIYVGYHFRRACIEGEVQGQNVAEYVYNNSFREEDSE